MKDRGQGARSKEQGTGSPMCRLLCALVVMLVFAGGCGRRVKGPPPPPTFSVTGEISDASGQPLQGILIQFISESDPSLNISAPIKDGKFTLVTAFTNQTKSVRNRRPLSREGHSVVRRASPRGNHAARHLRNQAAR